MSEGVRLFVGNLPNIGENELREEFSHYGNVTKVEIKEKRGITDEIKKFAFITLVSNNYNINQCIREFTENEWNGNLVKVSIAKESFMERLKKERNEVNNDQSSQVPIELPIIDKSNKSNINNSKKINLEEISIDKKLKKYDKNIKNDIPEIKTNNEIFKSHQDFSNVSKVQNLVNDDNEIILNNSTKISNEKRLQSIHNMKCAYNEKKNVIKMALSNVDKRNNKKIIFEDNEADECLQNTDNMDPKIFVSKSNENKHSIENNLKKRMLFDDSVSDEDYNIDIKEKYQGKSGQKLLEMQSHYKFDKRFILDERFIDDDTPIEPTETIEMPEDSEKQKQIEILQSILDPQGMNIPVNSNSSKKKNIKMMLRYDPTRMDHSKFITESVQPDMKDIKKNEKKQKNKSNEDTDKVIIKTAPEVSKERYYNVDETLKLSMEDSKPFSLLNLFGSKESDDYQFEKQLTQSDDTNKDIDSKSKKESENSLKSNYVHIKNESNIQNNYVEKRLNINLEKFFFSVDDKRFEEGLSFFMNNSIVSNESRDKLKFIVKKRIQNNIRNEQYQSKKGLSKNISKVKK